MIDFMDEGYLPIKTEISIMDNGKMDCHKVKESMLARNTDGDIKVNGRRVNSMAKEKNYFYKVVNILKEIFFREKNKEGAYIQLQGRDLNSRDR